MSVREHILQTVAAANAWMRGVPYQEWLNAFLPPLYISRELTPAAINLACMIIGPRQAGKSTLIWKTVSDMDQRTVLLNCEEPAIREWLASPARFLAEFKELDPQIGSIFLEEVQHLKEAGLTIKGIVDAKSRYKLFVTGSSSFHLEARTRESLAGRAERHILLPFSLFELERSAYKQELAKGLRTRDILADMLVFGGYPSVVFSSDPQSELARLVEAFIIRDASDRFRINNTAAFRKIMALAASQAGNLVNFSEWGSIAGISNDTAANYASLLEESNVIRLVRPFVGGKRSEIISTPKVFFLDNGIRNRMFGGFTPFAERVDIGVLAENFVFTELAKRTNPLLDGLYFWRNRSGAEVDFVVEQQGKLTGIEVKAGDCKGRISRSSRSFIEAYSPHRFLVISTGMYPQTNVLKTQVSFLKLEDLGNNTWL